MIDVSYPGRPPESKLERLGNIYHWWRVGFCGGWYALWLAKETLFHG